MDNNCPSRPFLEAFAQGNQDPNMQEHVNECQDCRRIVTEIQTGGNDANWLEALKKTQAILRKKGK